LIVAIVQSHILGFDCNQNIWTMIFLKAAVTVD